MKIIRFIVFFAVLPICVLVDFVTIITEAFPGDALGRLWMTKVLNWAIGG